MDDSYNARSTAWVPCVFCMMDATDIRTIWDTSADIFALAGLGIGLGPTENSSLLSTDVATLTNAHESKR